MKIFIRLVVIGLVVGLFYGMGCAGGEEGGTAATTEEGGADAAGVEDVQIGDCASDEALAALDDPSLSDDTRLAIQMSSICPAPETTIDKINQAEGAGAIDPLTAVDLRLKAYYLPDELPAEYVAAPAPDSDTFVSADLQYVVDHPDELPHWVPYTLPSENPDVSASVSKAGSAGLSFLPTKTKLKDGSTPAAKIFYVSGQEQKAETVRDAVDIAWPKAKSLLVDTYEPPLQARFTFSNNASSLRGIQLIAKTDEGGDEFVPAGTCKVKLNLAKLTDTNNLKSEAIHQMFHCWQKKLFDRHAGFENKWFGEATATWFEHHVCPTCKAVHRHLKNFFSGLHNVLIYADGKHEHASYVLFLFMEKSQGTAGEQFMTAKLLSIKSRTPREIVSDWIANNEKNWDAYATANFNIAPPFRFYADADIPKMTSGCGELTGACMPKNGSMKTYEYMAPQDLKDYKTFVYEGGMHYDLHTLMKLHDEADPNIRIKQVTIKYEDAENPHLRRQYAVKRGETWKPAVPINGKGEVYLCDETIDNVLVILENKDLNIMQGKQIGYQMALSTQCSQVGTTTITASMVDEDGYETVIIVEMEGSTIFDEDAGFLVLTKETITYYSLQETYAGTIECEGSKTMEWEKIKDKPHIKFRLYKDIPEAMVYDPYAFADFTTKCSAKINTGGGVVDQKFEQPAAMPTPVGENFNLQSNEITADGVTVERTLKKDGWTITLTMNYKTPGSEGSAQTN